MTSSTFTDVLAQIEPANLNCDFTVSIVHIRINLLKQNSCRVYQEYILNLGPKSEKSLLTSLNKSPLMQRDIYTKVFKLLVSDHKQN